MSLEQLRPSRHEITGPESLKEWHNSILWRTRSLRVPAHAYHPPISNQPIHKNQHYLKYIHSISKELPKLRARHSGSG